MTWRKRTLSPSQQRKRPLLECLEDRTTPSVDAWGVVEPDAVFADAAAVSSIPSDPLVTPSTPVTVESAPAVETSAAVTPPPETSTWTANTSATGGTSDCPTMPADSGD